MDPPVPRIVVEPAGPPARTATRIATREGRQRRRRGSVAGHVQLTHQNGLDGMRGLAVIAVMLFHAGVPWATGGYLGVEVFFVLSGFLITSLLVGEWRERGTIALRSFWARRARRLLPALFVLVCVIGIYYSAAGAAHAIPGLFGDGLAALLYYSNWHQLAAAGSYFAQSGAVSPFQHTWSLSIEEQFYVVWPLLVLGLLAVAGPRMLARRASASPRRPLTVLLSITSVGAAACWLEMLLLHSDGIDRIYYGSDTRASGLLTGAALAVWLALHQEQLALREVSGGRGGVEFDPGPLWTHRPRWATNARVSLASGAVLLALVLLMCLASGTGPWVYPWGLIVVDLGTALLIAGILQQPRSIAGGLMSLRPLRATGLISYGLYLWHFPLFLWLTSASTGLGGPLLLIVRFVAAFGASIASWVLVERPVRYGGRPALPGRIGRRLTRDGRLSGAADWFAGSIGRWIPAGAAAAVAALLAASLAGAVPARLPDAHALKPPINLAGTGHCSVQLTDTAAVGSAPVAAGSLSTFVLHALESHQISWSGSQTMQFRTCPPRRVLLVGDSLAFTLGAPMLTGQASYGVRLDDAAILGCAFATKGELDVNGTWESPAVGCPDAVPRWTAIAGQTHPQVVAVEMGYRDEFDWRWDGQVVHLGDPAFDTYVRSQIERFVTLLGDHGRRKLLLLTVPYVDPPAQADGSPAPAASQARHSAINAMLRAVARAHPRTVAVLDIDRTVSPAGVYTADVDGQLCRFDGIHFTTFCANLLEPPVLREARALSG